MTLPNINVTESTPGTLEVTWVHNPTLTPSTTLPSNSTICNLVFQAVGTPGPPTAVLVDSSALPLAATNENNDALTVTGTAGSLQIVNPVTPVTYYAGNTIFTGELNGCTTLPITVYDFTNISSFEFTVEYDSANWQYTPNCTPLGD